MLSMQQHVIGFDELIFVRFYIVWHDMVVPDSVVIAKRSLLDVYFLLHFLCRVRLLVVDHPSVREN